MSGRSIFDVYMNMNVNETDFFSCGLSWLLDKIRTIRHGISFNFKTYVFAAIALVMNTSLSLFWHPAHKSELSTL